MHHKKKKNFADFIELWLLPAGISYLQEALPITLKMI